MYSKVTQFLLKIFSNNYSKWRTQNFLNIYSEFTQYLFKNYSKFIPSLLLLRNYSKFTQTVLKTYSKIAQIVLKVYSNIIHNVLIIYSMTQNWLKIYSKIDQHLRTQKLVNIYSTCTQFLLNRFSKNYSKCT